jgi:hypothetical protein
MAASTAADPQIAQLVALLDADRRRAYPSGDSIVLAPPQIERGEEYAVFGGSADVPDVLEEFCVAKIYSWPDAGQLADD